MRPNIILIMADDMGFECLGAYGSTSYQTPNLDQIASENILVSHCIANPLCTPSRVKIMTGMYNYHNYEKFGYLNPEERTFGHMMQEAGYKTCIIGKWQLNGLSFDMPGNQDLNRPVEMGFGEYCLWQLNSLKKKGERFANPLIVQNGKELPRDPDAYGPDIVDDQSPTDGLSFLGLFDEENFKGEDYAYVYYDPEWGKFRNNRNVFVQNDTYKLYQDGSMYNIIEDVNEKHALNSIEIQNIVELRRKMKEILDAGQKMGDPVGSG